MPIDYNSFKTLSEKPGVIPLFKDFNASYVPPIFHLNAGYINDANTTDGEKSGMKHTQ
jgi:hypothetical protein